MNILVICASNYEKVRFKDALNHVDHINKYRIIETERGKISTAIQTALEVFSSSAPHYDLILLPKFVYSNGFYNIGDLVIPCKCKDSSTFFNTSFTLQGNDDAVLFSLEDYSNVHTFAKSIQGPALFDNESSAVCYIADQTDTPVMVVARVVDLTNNPQSSNYDYDSFSFTDIIWYVESMS